MNSVEKQRHDEVIYRGLTKLKLKRLSIGMIFGLIGVFICIGIGVPKDGDKLTFNLIVLVFTGVGYGFGSMIFKKQN